MPKKSEYASTTTRQGGNRDDPGSLMHVPATWLEHRHAPDIPLTYLLTLSYARALYEAVKKFQ